MTPEDKESLKRTFSFRLDNAIREKNISREELAQKLGIDVSNISHYISLKNPPNIYNLVAIADELDVSTDYLLGRSDILAANITDEIISHELHIDQDILNGLRANINDINNLITSNSFDTDYKLILKLFLNDKSLLLSSLIYSIARIQQCKDYIFFHSIPALKDDHGAKEFINILNTHINNIEFTFSKSILNFLNNSKNTNFSFFSPEEIKKLKSAKTDEDIYKIISQLSSKLSHQMFVSIPDFIYRSPLYRRIVNKFDTDLLKLDLFK